MQRWVLVVFLAVLAVVGIVIAIIPAPLRPGDFAPSEIELSTQGDFMQLDTETLTFVDSKRVHWIAPKGTLTDGATVPRLALTVTDGRFDAAFLKAAVVHDAYCQRENRDRTPEQYCARPWKDIHRMFFEASVAGGTNLELAKLMYAAVLLGGPRCDDEKRDLQHLPDEVLIRGFSGTKTWIEQDNPSVEEIEAFINTREPLLVELHELEVGVTEALNRGDNARANELLRDQQVIIERELSKSPDDAMLKLFDGHMRMNRGMLYQRQEADERAEAELTMSQSIFESVNDQQGEDAAALVGLSTVSVLRGDLIRGEEFARKALTVAPELEAAQEEVRRIRELKTEPPARTE